MNEQKLKKIYKWAEDIFLLLSGSYLIYLTLLSTTFTFKMFFPPAAEKLLLALLTLTGAFRLLLFFRLTPASRKKAFFLFLPSLLIAAVWLMVYRNDGYSFLLFLAVLTPASFGIGYRKFLKVYAAAVGLTVLTTVFCALGDVITNYVYVSSTRLRSCWGFGYMTDFASCLVFLCIAAWIAWKDTPGWVFLIPGTASLLTAYFIADSNTSVYCSLLFLIFVLLQQLLRFERLNPLRKLTGIAAAAAFPIGAALMILMTRLYAQGNAFAARINTWSHDRLSLSLDAWELWGLKLFGSPLTQIGSGSSLVRSADYNFVDSSYMLIPLRYGLLIFLILLVLWPLMTRAAARSGDLRLMLGLALIAFHALSEHHFTEINYNLFLILPLPVLFPALTLLPEREAAAAERPARTRAFLLTCLIGACAQLLLPRILSRFRTLCALTGFASVSRNRQAALFAALFAAFAFLALFLRAAFRAGLAFFGRRPLRRRDILILGAGLLIAAAAFAGTELLFQKSLPPQRAGIEADRPAVEAIRSAEDCGLYVTGIPELYRREFPEFRAAFYPREDLSRMREIAVITDSAFESRAMLQSGFLYAEISDRRAVYTNSQSAIAALTDAGFHLTGYFSKALSADFPELAIHNGMSCGEDGTLLISAEKPLLRGQGLDLFASAYTVSFVLSAETEDPLPPDPETPVCRLLISDGSGDRVFTEQTLPLSAFAAPEPLTFSLAATLPDTADAAFAVIPLQTDVPLRLHDIRWQKTPAYDVHRIYDGDRHVIHDAYYDLDGAPLTLSAGYQARDLGYDRDGNNDFIRYLDTEGAPVMATSVFAPQGHAELRREFSDKLVTAESYYDTESRPVNIGIGYSRIQREYTPEKALSLSWFYDTEGRRLECGSSYFHEFLQTLDRDNKMIFIAIKDDGTYSLTKTLQEDLFSLGIKTDLRGKYRNSFYAVITPEEVIEDLSGTEAIGTEGQVADITYEVKSAGFSLGNFSSIKINGQEYAKNQRGLNFVIYDLSTKEVAERITFDTCWEEMRVTR